MSTAWRKFDLKIDDKKCNGCGNCVIVCPINAAEGAEIVLRVKDGNALLFTPEKCDGCGVCVENCPVNAIVVDVEEVLPAERVIDTTTKVISETEATELTASIKVERPKVSSEALQKITSELKTINELMSVTKIRMLIESGKEEQAWEELKKRRGGKIRT